jgi:pimeloyl-ACP methyl ester carboxylesterase
MRAKPTEAGPVLGTSSEELDKLPFICAAILLEITLMDTHSLAGECRWFAAEQSRARAAVVAIHGLNNRPEIMDPLIGELNCCDLSVCRVALAQHNSFNKHDILALWEGNVAAAINECKEHEPDLPVFLLGYSLGAGVGVRYLQQYPTAFERLFLLAPAIRLRCSSLILQPLARVGAGSNLAIPSFAPKDIRSRNGTPLAEYDAMFRMARSLKLLGNAGELGAIPARVLVNPKDELVSFKKLRLWIDANNLSAWKLNIIRVSDRAAYQHLIVLPESLGQANWRGLVETMTSFMLAENEDLSTPRGF